MIITQQVVYSTGVSSKATYTAPSTIEIIPDVWSVGTSCNFGGYNNISDSTVLISFSRTSTSGDCVISFPIRAKAVGAAQSGSFSDLEYFNELGNGQIEVVASPKNASASFSPDTIYTDQSSELTLSLSNTGNSALSGGAFNYTLPSMVEFDDSITPISNCTTDAPSVSGYKVSINNISLAAGASCEITFTVKGQSVGSVQSGEFGNLTSMGSSGNGTIQVEANPAASGSTVSIPSSGLLGLLMLILASIGVGRYYAKR